MKSIYHKFQRIISVSVCEFSKAFAGKHCWSKIIKLLALNNFSHLLFIINFSQEHKSQLKCSWFISANFTLRNCGNL